MGTKEVISKSAAQREIESIEEIFETEYDDGDKEKFLPAVQEGRIVVDSQNQSIEYTLARPIELKNGETMDKLTFRAPSVMDIEYMNEGFKLTVDQSGNTTMDMGAMQKRTNRAVTRLSGLQLGLIDRLSRKDMRAFGGLFNFFE